MKNVTPDFVTAQASPISRRVREIYYRRRYWDSTEGKYIWENDWRNVEQRDYSFVSAPITFSLYRQTTGSDTWTLAEGAIPNPAVGDEFGIKGYFLSNEPFSGSPSNYYTVQHFNRTLARQWRFIIMDDAISNDIAGIQYSMNCRVYHEYALRIKADLTIDLYVDGVFIQNMGGGTATGPGPFPSMFAFQPNLAMDAGVVEQWAKLYSIPGPDSEVVTPSARARSRIKDVSPITWQLDTDQLTEFKVSNVSITLENFENEWDPLNLSGHFAADAQSTAGYEPYWTKFQIRSGFQHPDGAREYVTLFTGLAVEFRRNAKERNVQIDVYGQEAFMLNSQAENIATHVEDENAGTGNGVTTEFTTDFTGVGGIDEVKVAGLVKIEGQDYTVSQINETALTAKVTFTDAPDIGEAVLIDYYYWPQGEEFNDLVSLLIDEWLQSDEDNSTDIRPFVVANNVINSQEFTSDSDWGSGTFTGALSKDMYNGTLAFNHEHASLIQATTWSDSLTGWTWATVANGITSTGGKLRFTRVAGGQEQIDREIYRSFTNCWGSWQFTAQFLNNPVHVQILGIELFKPQGSGQVGDFQISPTHGCRFYGQTFAFPDYSAHVYKVTRHPNGTIRLYIDGVLTSTSTYVGKAFQFSLRANMRSEAAVAVIIDVWDISVPTSQAEGTWESPAIDWTTTPFSWGPFIRSVVKDRAGSPLASGAGSGVFIDFSTNVSVDNFATSDGYLDMTETDTYPASTVKRYVKVKIALYAFQDRNYDPNVNAFTIQAYSASIPVLLPKLSGKNVYEAIQSLAAFANYEFGIDSDQVFFFRPKATSGEPVMYLAQDDLIEEVSDLQNGYERVYSKVEITYGEYVKRVEASDSVATSPATRFLKKTFELSADANIYIAPSADIATAMSRDYFARLSVLRRRFKIRTKFLPQLELSDLINCSFAFDTSGDQSPLLNAVPAKIIGARYDTDRYTCEFDCEEVPA